MIKKYTALLSFCCVFYVTKAEIKVTELNKVVDSSTPTAGLKIDINNDGNQDFTFNSFANGAISITGVINSGFNNYIAVAPIQDNIFQPVRVKNNQVFSAHTNWRANPIFIHSPVLNFTEIAGKGNQYIVGRFTISGVPSFFYFYFLINLNKEGTSLNLIKCAYETDAELTFKTGNEGEEQGVGLLELHTLNNFHVYPQPALNLIRIETGGNVSEGKIFNLNGQLIQHNSVILNDQIDVASIPKGVYLLQITNEKSMILTKKIIIE